MILTFVDAQGLRRVTIPEVADGQISVRDPAGKEALQVVARNGAWRLTACSMCTPVDALPERLMGGQFLRLRWREKGALLLVQDRRTAGKYVRLNVPDVMELTVGSAKDNSILLSVPMVMAHHLKLSHHHGVWQLHAIGAVYVNGRRTMEKALRLGDAVWVMGLTIIPFEGGIALSYLPKALSFGTWNPLRAELNANRTPIFKAPELTWFSRIPRIRKRIKATLVSAQLPPSMAAEPQKQTALSMAPALTSGLFMMLSGIGSVASLGMIAGNIALPLLGRKKAMQQHETNENMRQQAYKEYLAKTEQELRLSIAENQRQLREQVPDPASEALKLLKDTRHLWERRLKDDDFLALRMGTGCIPLRCSVQLSPPAPGEPEDPLVASLKAFLNKGWALEAVPIVLSLDKYQVIGIAGSPKARGQMQERILSQLALHAAYDELRLCILGMPEKNAEPYLRLPHLWNRDKTMRYIATHEEEIGSLIPALEQEISARQNESNQAGELVVLITDGAIAKRYIIESLLLERKLLHVHVLVFAEHSHELPSACNGVIGLRNDRGVLCLSGGTENDLFEFHLDTAAMPSAQKIVHLLENTRLEQSDTTRHLADVVPFLNLFDVTEPKALNIATRWRRNVNAAAATLATPLGVDEDGQLCVLDIHEKAQGPHGLIAGTTGSGKSELIMTYILGLAVNFSPNEVNFALIDYKGGGTANVFEGLPHLAGTISNLDGSTVKRCMVSIKSELKRRQDIVNKARTALHITESLDHKEYQRYFAQGRLKEPMPHLLIIVDEFAQLKSNEPEFMKELISVAQVGRSLGVHMILSTQKPTGVVDDQITSNTNFRICLRVQTPQDSQEMLGGPDAASLRGVGRFLIKSQDIMIRAQSGWTGASLNQGHEKQFDGEVEILDRQGRVICRQAMPSTASSHGNEDTQLSAVLRQIAETSRAMGLRARQLWMPELEGLLPVDALRKRYAAVQQPYVLRPLLGEIDVPEEQIRKPLLIDLNAGRNTIVFGTHGSGKRMLLETLLDDLLNFHAADELTIYLLDLAGDGLVSYAAAPQVGDVITMDEEDKFHNLIRLLERELLRRRKALHMEDSDIPTRLRKAGIPNILVVIHSLKTFCDLAEPQREQTLKLLGDGPRYGIHFFATSIMASGISTQISQQFPQQLVLQMAFKDDYALLLGNTKGMVPGKEQGRGLIRFDELHEFQTACVQEKGAALCQRLAENWSGQQALPVPMMPDTISAQALTERLHRLKQPLRLPLGIYRDSLSTAFLSADKRCIFRVMGKQDELQGFLLEWTACMAQAADIIALDGSNMFKDSDAVRCIGPEGWAACVEELLKDRLRDMEFDDGETLPERLTLIILTDVQQVWERLQEDPCSNGEPAGNEVLAPLLIKVKPTWKLRFVLCGDPSAFERVKLQGWYQKAVASSDAVYFGDNFKYQYICEYSGKPIGEDAPFPMGYVVSSGTARSAKMVSTCVETAEEDEEW